MENRMSLIAGSSNQELAKEISSCLDAPLIPIEIKNFNDRETYIHIEKSVRGSSVFIIQPTSPPVNDKLMELLLIIDACKRASAKDINVIVPYYGYSRQDRKTLPREPISAKLVANLIEKAGADKIVTFDLHVDQIQGFFNIPVDNLEAVSLIADYFLDNISGPKGLQKRLDSTVVVSPDVGGARRARRLAKILGTSIAIIDKRRPEHGVAEIMNIIGDVKGKDAIIIDDMIDTAGTITNAAKALKAKGANDVYITATHALLSGPAIKRLEESPIKQVVVTNTISIPKKEMIKKLKVISLARLLADSIRKTYEGTPMGVLFDDIYDKIEKKKKLNA